MCLFGGAHGCGEVGGGEGRGQEEERFALLKKYRTYPAITNVGTIIPFLKKIQKIYESRDIPLSFSHISIFFNGNQQNLLYQEIPI